jgi:hypothetical protein
MAQAQLDAAEYDWMLASEVNVPLSSSAVGPVASSKVLVYRYYRSTANDITVDYYDSDVLRPNNYIVHVPSFRYSRLGGWASGNSRLFLRIGVLDAGRPDRPRFEPLHHQDSGELVCNVITLYRTGGVRLCVGVDDEYVALKELHRKKWRLGDIWGVGNRAYYWLQIVVAETAAEAETLPFYSRKVQFAVAFSHERGAALPRTNRKRKEELSTHAPSKEEVAAFLSGEIKKKKPRKAKKLLHSPADKQEAAACLAQMTDSPSSP